MDAEEIRARLAAGERPIVAAPAQPGGAVAPSQVARTVHGGEAAGARPAAVLVPLVPGGSGGLDGAVLLTRRAAHLARHAGQVSFPGGRIDPDDPSAEAAALRESEEEIGLGRAYVELAGRLPAILTGTGYHVTPVVGVLRPGYALSPSADEVESVFLLPFSTLLDPAAPQRRRVELRGVVRETWVWPHDEHYIWGATAAILVELAERLSA